MKVADLDDAVYHTALRFSGDDHVLDRIDQTGIKEETVKCSGKSVTFHHAWRNQPSNHVVRPLTSPAAVVCSAE